GDQAVIGWGITGDQIFRREFDETDQVVCADIARSGNFFATGTALGSIGIWNRAGEPIMKWPTDSLVLSVAIAPKENLLAAAIGESSLLLWPLTRDSKPQIIASESTLYCVAFTPSGDTVAVCNSRGEVLLYSVRGELLNKFLADSLGNMLFTIGVSPDGRYLATGGVRDTAWVYDFSGKRIQTMTGHQGSITYITFSPDGKYILTGSSKLWRNSEGDNTMKLWDVNAANLQHYPLQSTSGGYGVAFSPTGDTLLTGTERYFALYHHLERYLNAAHLAKITGKMQQTIGIDLADFEDEAIKNQKAMEQQIAIVDFTEQEFSKNPSDDGTRVRLASAYGSLAWFYLFVNKPEKSIDAAKKALQLDSSQTWVNTNLALGYLFVDQWDEAEKIYRRLYKDDWQKSGFGSSKLKTFLEAFEDDLKNLRKAHIVYKDLEKAENLLKDLAHKK
ncbi:MAG: hypothetical protein ABIQ93_00970, partial [Saprospiraceae bacterium]